MSKQKFYLFIVLCIIILIAISALVINASFPKTKPVTIANCPERIMLTGPHLGNNRQHNSSVWLGCYNGQLYYFGGEKNDFSKTKYDDALYVFQDGDMREVTNLLCKKENITILAIVDNLIYYLETRNNNYAQKTLYSFNLKTNQESLLYSGAIYPVSSLFFAHDGTVYFPLKPVSGEAPQFVHVAGEDVLGVVPLNEGYPLGDHVYYVVSEYSDAQVERILKATPDSNAELEEISLGQAYNRSVIPYKDGLLVHNEGLNSLLYRIDNDGCVTELFSVSCLASKSAVNIHETDAYISVLRYEKYGEKGMLRFNNDSVEGTYRISLLDGSIEKINDMCFDGMYNFDDTCFYCCDSMGNVYKMEFDGTIDPIMLISEDG